MMRNPKPPGLTREDVPPPPKEFFRTVWYVHPSRRVMATSLITEWITLERGSQVPLQRYDFQISGYVDDMRKTIPDEGLRHGDYFFLKHGFVSVDESRKRRDS